MSLTTIQISNTTKKKLEHRKLHPRESYESVLRRVFHDDHTPSLKEIFERGDKIPQRVYTTNEIVELIHELREERITKHARPPTTDTHPK